MNKKFFALLISLVLGLSLTACGGQTGNSVTDPAPSSTAEPSAASDPSPAEDDAPSGSSELEAYISQNRSLIDAMSASMMEDGMDVEVAAKENSLVCDFSFDFKSDEVELESLKALLEVTLDSAEPTFTNILSFMRREVPSTESIVVNYLDQDGELLSTREYRSTAQSGEAALPEGVYDSLESYVSEHRDELDQRLSGLAPNGMSLNITAKGSTMIYNVSFIDSLEELGLSRETLKNVLDEQTNSQEAAFISVLNTLREEIPFIESIQLNYLENDGSVITSKDFQ